MIHFSFCFVFYFADPILDIGSKSLK